jgi:hypothetical protein
MSSEVSTTTDTAAHQFKRLPLEQKCRAILNGALERLVTGDMKGEIGTGGLTFVQKLAKQMFLDPAAAAKLSAPRNPAVKAAIERASALNAPKQAIMDRLARCKDRGSVYDDVPKDEANFFRDMPRRLYSLRSWTKEDPSWERMEHAYLPLNENGIPLGEEAGWRGCRASLGHRAWFFRCDPREFGMLIDEDPHQPDAHHWNCGEPLRCIYTVRDVPNVNSTKRDPEFLAVYAGRLRRLLAEATPGGGLSPEW